MPKICAEFGRLLELENPMEETRKKFCSTFIIIDGELHKLEDVGMGTKDWTLLTRRYRGKEESTLITSVTSIKPFLPVAGYYKTEEGQFYVEKVPKRQWYKSFKPQNYMFYFLGRCVPILEFSPLIQWSILLSMLKTPYPDFCCVNADSSIECNNKVIGYVKGSSTFVCTNPLFEQEIKDWSRYAT